MLSKIIKNIFIWRLVILVVSVFAIYLLPTKDCCQTFGSNLSPAYLTRIWANFAGENFLDLARFGYGWPMKLSTYVFFPLFPVAIRLLTIIIPSYLASGLVLVHLSLILALYYLYKLVRLDHKEKIAQNIILLLLVFPSAFFFGAVYTESFFLLLVVISFYQARKENFFRACLFGLLASATRFTGIFLWPALAWEVWQGHAKRIKKKKMDINLVWLILPPLGLLSFMRHLLIKTGDPFMFLKTTPDFGPNIIITKLILLHQVFFRYGRMLTDSQWTSPLFFVVLTEFIVGLLFLVLSVWAFKKLRRSYAIFTFLSYLAPTFTGTFTGLPRYVLTIFPAFILLSLWFTDQKPIIKKIYLAINIAVAIFLIVLFTRGYFVG